MTPAAALSIRHVSKTFGDTAALSDVCVSVAEGEMVALIGPSGSGKSTLLRAAAALTRIDGGVGEIDTFGVPLQARGRYARKVRQARTRIGVVFQQFNLVGRLTLFTNVALGALGRTGFWRGLVGAWPRQTRADALEALARVGVAALAGQRANTLSGGQQQRGAIARGLVQKARILLADEPVASLDPTAARNVMEILRELNRSEGLTVVVTLHQVDYALTYCDRVVALSQGRIAFDRPVAEVDASRLAGVYGRTTLDDVVEQRGLP
jgi:phosphonate transport system ATP-binding protein